MLCLIGSHLPLTPQTLRHALRLDPLHEKQNYQLMYMFNKLIFKIVIIFQLNVLLPANAIQGYNTGRCA